MKTRALLLRVVGTGTMCGLVTVTVVQPRDSPAFEVASVKPNKSDAQPPVIGFQPGGRFVATMVSARELIRMAYGTAGPLETARLISGPSWAESDRFDIVAKAQDDAPQPLILLMLRSLLSERFKLAVHTESRELPIYALVMARSDGKLGLRLRAVADCTPEARGRDTASLPEAATCGGRGAIGHLEFGGLPLSVAVVTNGALLREVRRIIVDRTGLTGAFEGSLDWTPSEPAGSQSDPFSSPPPLDGASVFTALQEQLGLKLVPSTGPVDVFVIDHIERPEPD